MSLDNAASNNRRLLLFLLGLVGSRRGHINLFEICLFDYFQGRLELLKGHFIHILIRANPLDAVGHIKQVVIAGIAPNHISSGIHANIVLCLFAVHLGALVFALAAAVHLQAGQADPLAGELPAAALALGEGLEEVGQFAPHIDMLTNHILYG